MGTRILGAYTAIMKVALLLFCLGVTAVASEVCVQEDNCKRPDCVCASTSHPLGPVPVEYLPQFVVVSFNDAVTPSNYQFYHEILTNYTNPNGCPMSMTMFLNHHNNDYSLTNELWRLGCEIAVRSVTPSPISYWENANYSTWHSEFSDCRAIISKYARIPEDDIIGIRAPYMQIGGDTMYSALKDAGFKYDSSWTALDYTNWYGKSPKGALYPYTLDFQSPQIPDDCPVGKCPEEKYPGLYVTPVLDLKSTLGQPCNMIDACQSWYNQTDCPEKLCEDNVFNFLKENFDYNYKDNRAPFGLHTAPQWFQSDEILDSTAHHNGYKRFLEYAQSLEDVWIVSHDKVLEWMKTPVPASNVGSLEAFQCPPYPPTSVCPNPLKCDYDGVPMKICSRPCPPNYPGLGNVDGN